MRFCARNDVTPGGRQSLFSTGIFVSEIQRNPGELAPIYAFFPGATGAFSNALSKVSWANLAHRPH